MTIKRFYGTTIKEAKAEARNNLGEGVIILESKEATANSPASIAVMAKTAPAEPKVEETVSTPTYSREAIRETANAFAEVFKNNQYQESYEPVESFEEEIIPDQEEEKPRLSRRNISLIQNQIIEEEETTADFRPPVNKPSDVVLEKSDNQNLLDRIERLEQLIASNFIQANADLISLPVYQQLLNSGIPAGTINRWMNETIGLGADPFTNRVNFLNQLGAVIQKNLPHDSSLTVKRVQVFVGPSGAGKTSLITKLTRNKHLLAGNNVAIVSLNPGEQHSSNALLIDHANKHQFEFFEANNANELAKLNAHLKNFDHILIDTPAISLHPKKAEQELAALEQQLQLLQDYELHFVVNTTLNQCYFNENYLNNYPLRPDFIALTHLDEALSWGHFLPLIEVGGCAIRYISDGANPFDEVKAYSKSWFTEKLLSTNEF